MRTELWRKLSFSYERHVKWKWNESVGGSYHHSVDAADM